MPDHESVTYQITTLNLTEEQMDYLREVKSRTGAPMGYQIRKIIDDYLHREKVKAGVKKRRKAKKA
jgi:hypothetical protein